MSHNLVFAIAMIMPSVVMMAVVVYFLWYIGKDRKSKPKGKEK